MGPIYPQPGDPIGLLPSEGDYTDLTVYPDPEQAGIGPGAFPLSGFPPGEGAIGGNDLAPGSSATDTGPGATTGEFTATPPDSSTGDLIQSPFDGEDGSNHGSEFIYGVDNEPHESGDLAPDGALLPLPGQGDGATAETPAGEEFWEALFKHTMTQLVPEWAREDEDEEMEG